MVAQRAAWKARVMAAHWVARWAALVARKAAPTAACWAAWTARPTVVSRVGRRVAPLAAATDTNLAVKKVAWKD
jgi:hypothetical protein